MLTTHPVEQQAQGQQKARVAIGTRFLRSITKLLLQAGREAAALGVEVPQFYKLRIQCPECQIL